MVAGCVDAMNNLARLNEHGEGVIQSVSSAVALYERAARAGHPDAQTNLGYMFQVGASDSKNCLPVNPEVAKMWYEAAAGQGYARAQHLLGMLHFSGQITGQTDYSQAVRWFSYAAEQVNIPRRFEEVLRFMVNLIFPS